jgi:alanine-glyoxylate transaminase/serine-glyoxylate transaminase/serine-pyruvate transaminase
MVSEKLLLIPGPSPVHPRILQALARPTISHVSPILAEELKETLADLKRIVFTETGEPVVIAGAGTLSMEMALVNTVGLGERVLVLSQGYFGERMAQICESFGLASDVLAAPWGRAVVPEDLERRLSEADYAAVVATHVDTATGACAPVRAYADILRGRGILYIVDGVCATGGIEERQDDWEIDVILTAAQKCLGAPPGLALAVFSARAVDKRRRLRAVPAYYADLQRWLPVMKDPTRYFSTPCVNELRALREATRIIMEEGLTERFARHARIARALRAGLARLGFSLYTEEPFLADTLSVVRYPDGLEDKAFRARYLEEGVVVAGGLAETAGRVFRMGHLGNLTADQALFALEALEKTLAGLSRPVSPGSGRRAAEEVLART